MAVLGLCLMSADRAIAVVDPLASPNNKIGVHILDPNEITTASKLVNGESGSWGYVTVPIQGVDRNREKWISFMKKAKQEKVIPIIRVATVVNNVHWEEPSNYDLVDFANFLNDLPWPTRNRYVVIFNEVNRADEFGGFVAPERYADILANAVTIFKERNEDFFIVPAGLDNAASSNGSSLQWKAYWQRVVQRQPDIFDRVDGWSSHSYPNPAFSGSPFDRHDRSVAAFRHELNFLKLYTSKELPVFITETGWDMSRVDEERAAQFMKISYEQLWTDERVVAVTPFLLQAGAGPFVSFSLLDANAQPRPVYDSWRELALKGEPELGQVSSAAIVLSENVEAPPVAKPFVSRVSFTDLRSVFSWFERLFGLKESRVKIEKTVRVGGREYQVELAQNDAERARGLGGKTGLGPSQGMLFVFDKPAVQSFWMKGMKFDIEIIWIRENKVIQVDMAYYRQPFKTISPGVEVDHVLEVAVGSGIKVGDTVEL